MNRAAAIAEIRRIFSQYKALTAIDKRLLRALKNGKLYELFVLSKLVQDLRKRGFTLKFQGTTLKFKASPGRIKKGDPHFEVMAPGSQDPDFWIFVDIEFETLGHQLVGATDSSRRHELDIVVVTTDTGYPDHSKIALAVECKAVANFQKSIVKEALGVRREMCLLADQEDSILTDAGGSPPIVVRATPASEFWLAFIHVKGKNYEQSPGLFGISFRHLQP
jgi:hypothetical protein